MKTYKHIAFAVLALSMAACSQEDDFTPQVNQKGAPISIASAGVANLTTRANITTTNGTDYLTGGSMGVFVTSTNTDNRYQGSNMKWEYDGGWTMKGNSVALYEADGTRQAIGAYYPYKEALTDGKYPVELPETFGSDYENYDYLYADYVAVSINPMNIGMSHLFSKVTVSIAKKGSEIGDDAVQSVSLFDVPRTADWTVPAGTLNNYGSDDQVTVLYANDTNNNETVDNYVGYALPNGATTLSVRVTMASGRSYAAKASVTYGVTSGNHYLVTLKLGKDAMDVVSVTSVADWGTPENNPTGSDVTEIFINSIVLGTTAAVDILSGATEGVKTAIEALLTANPTVTTLTVNGTPTAAQQEALAAALANFSGTLIMDMTDAVEAIKYLSCTKRLGGYAYDEASNTYTAYTEAGLNVWREAVANNNQTNLTLGADIILSTEGIEVTDGKPNGSNWIAVESIDKATLDGDGHSIVNLRIYSEYYACFIAKITNSTIKNLTLVNPIVYGTYPYTAALIRVSHINSSVVNCHIQGGSVTGEDSGTGGLIAAIAYYKNHIYGCTNSAKVTGSEWVGGIVGTVNLTNNVFAACANTGEISGNSKVGGIVGSPQSSEELIACYTTEGTICGNTDATVTSCYYVAAEESDEEDGTTAVVDETALNTSEVVDAMNAAIDTYNSTATVKASYKWKVGTTLPELVVAE